MDDEPEVLAVMLDMIALLGHWAAGVSSAEGARDRFLEGVFDVLLTDVASPALSGFDLVDIPVSDAVWLQKTFGIDALEQAFARLQGV